MTITRRTALTGAASAALVAGLAPGAFAQGQPRKLRFGFATKAMSPIVINIVIPEKLGYYAQEGISVESIPMGSNAAVLAGVDAKRIEFAVGVPSFQLQLVAKGEALPAVNFFEYTYPFKWAMAVEPDAGFKQLGDLKGKRIGVSGFGQSDFPVGKAVLGLVGLDPEKDVNWLAVGEGVSAGQALVRGDIDGLWDPLESTCRHASLSIL